MMQDRADCPQLRHICRSPYCCTRFARCMDLVAPEEELKLLLCSDDSYYARTKAKKGTQ